MTSSKPIWSKGLLILGLLFLLNPVPMLFDLLPDALGYFFIFLAIRRLSALQHDFEELKNATLKLLLISLIKIPCFFFMLMIWGSSSSQRVIVPTFTLGFCVVELVFGLPFISLFFSSFARLGERYSCNVALTGVTKTPETMERMFRMFFLVRCVLSTLPEFALVPNYAGRVEAITFNWNNAYPYLAIASAIAVMVFAIILAPSLFSYIREIHRDGVSSDLLKDAYYKLDLQKRSQFLNVRIASAAFICAAIASIDLYFDNLNYLPDMLCGLGFLLVIWSLTYATGSKKVVPFTISFLYLGATILHFILFNDFFHSHTIYSIEYTEAGRAAYKTVLISSFVQELLGVILLITVHVLIIKLIDLYTGHFSEDATQNHIELRMRRELTRVVWGTTIFGCLTCLVSFVYELTLADIKIIETEVTGDVSPLYVPQLEWFNVVVWVVSLLWLVFSIWMWTRIREETALNLKFDD